MPSRPAAAPPNTASWAGLHALVTGGAGFVGSNLVHALVARGAEVAVLDALAPSTGANLRNLDGVRDRVQFVHGDVRDAAALGEALPDSDVVFHCAAQTSHPASLREPLEHADVNVRGTLVLLEAVRRAAAPPKVVHVGTTTQVGRMVREPIDEEHPEDPLDVYSATKVASEKFTLAYAHAHGLPTTSVRACNLYGPRAMIRSPEFGFVNYFIGLGLQGLPIPVFGPGDQRRSLLYVDDAVDALLRAARSPGADGRAFLLGSDRSCTVWEIATTIGRVVGGRAERVPFPPERRRIEVGDAVVDWRRARELLGWAPRHDLEAGLAPTRDYYRSALEHYLRAA